MFLNFLCKALDKFYEMISDSLCIICVDIYYIGSEIAYLAFAISSIDCFKDKT